MSCFGYVEINCGGCGVAFQMAEATYNARREDHENFHCPNGCVRHYAGPSPKDARIRALEEQVRVLNRQYEYMRGSRDSWREAAKHEERRRVGYQGALSRARKDPTFLAPKADVEHRA